MNKKDDENILLENQQRSRPSSARSSRSKRKLDSRELKLRVLVIICIILIILIIVTFCLSLFVPMIISGSNKQEKKCNWNLVCLGNNGGLTEESLTSFLLAPMNSNEFVALDAGTLLFGIRKFVEKQGLIKNSECIDNDKLSFEFPKWSTNEMQRAGHILRNHVKSYFIGHAHLDHVAGLVHVSPEDYSTDPSPRSPVDSNVTVGFKKIFGIQSTIQTIDEHLFNGKVWPDLVELTHKYQYQVLEGNTVYNMNEILPPRNPAGPSPWRNINVKVFDTCHDTVNSTAYLFDAMDSQVLFFSDTGPSSNLQHICDWKAKINQVIVDPLLNATKLSAIIIETSFPNEQPDNLLFGHLRPVDLFDILNEFAITRGLKKDTVRLQVVIFHPKPSFGPGKESTREVIARQLKQLKDTQGFKNLEIILPEQGALMCIP